MQSPTPRRGLSPGLLLFLILPLLGIFAAAMLILSESSTGTPAFVPSPSTPEPVVLPTLVDVLDAPVIDFALPLLANRQTGNTVNLTNYAGRIVFLNFWATWCEPCERELPAFMTFTNSVTTADNAPIILAVNYGEPVELVSAWLEERAISGLPVLLDTDRAVGESYGVFNLPVTFVIDARGIVRYPIYGEATLELLNAYVDALNAET